jgi:hypothetical protein
MKLMLGFHLLCARCVQYGTLTYEEAERLHQLVCERKKRLRLGGASAPSPTKSSSVSQPKKKKTKVSVMKENEFDPELTISGEDRIGLTTI